MKWLAVAAGAALTLASHTSPVFASTTAPSSIVLRTIGSERAGAVRAVDGCTQPASVATAYWVKPTIADEEGVNGLASVAISLNQAGKLVRATLYSSSGNRWLDDAALTSARMSEFNSEVDGCRHVGGSYLYEVSF